MPVWLLTLITKILEPIILSIIDKIGLSIRISQLESKADDVRAAFTKLAQAKTQEEYKNAAHDLATRWN